MSINWDSGCTAIDKAEEYADADEYEPSELLRRIEQLENHLRQVLEEVDGPGKPHSSDSYLPQDIIESIKDILGE